MVTGNGGDGDRKWRWRLCWDPVTEALQFHILSALSVARKDILQKETKRVGEEKIRPSEDLGSIPVKEFGLQKESCNVLAGKTLRKINLNERKVCFKATLSSNITCCIIEIYIQKLLRFSQLMENKISTIERGAFQDLKELERLQAQVQALPGSRVFTGPCSEGFFPWPLIFKGEKEGAEMGVLWQVASKPAEQRQHGPELILLPLRKLLSDWSCSGGWGSRVEAEGRAFVPLPLLKKQECN
ncbi:Slit-like protein 2 protein [Anas platyrhynchos]|uniref:Slit-like protein 2 protein n=1 Tax=Anas platyrhynchos TaxID=8839 RepID=R0LQ63_ANAPL|nr:Slit-like protein 2 protein [Anas platyrhynchos]